MLTVALVSDAATNVNSSATLARSWPMVDSNLTDLPRLHKLVVAVVSHPKLDRLVLKALAKSLRTLGRKIYTDNLVKNIVRDALALGAEHKRESATGEVACCILGKQTKVAVFSRDLLHQVDDHVPNNTIVVQS